MIRSTMMASAAVVLGLTSTPVPAYVDKGCARGCEQALDQDSVEYRACMAGCMKGWSPDARENDPFLCRFGALEAGAPVLLAATRDDCARAGGAVVTPSDATTEGATE